MKKSNLFVGVFLNCLCFSFVFAEEIELEKIVVTPYRYSEEFSNAPASLVVISEEDIKNSNAQKVLDIIRTVPGVTVRDWFGNAVKASVDIRGFGEQSAMNTLVLVDGRRVNEIDLSGVDWMQIPIEQIERIEVLKSGMGSVLYGDNACAAVINIITKKGKGKPKLYLQTQTGSYDMYKEGFIFSGAKDNFDYRLSSSYESTHGYRKNSFYKTFDLGTKFNFQLTDDLSLHFNQGFHKSSYGLPGALLENDLKLLSRRDTKYGRDHADSKDYYFNIVIEKEFSKDAEISLDTSFRRKETFTNFIDANGGWNPIYKSKIDTIGICPKYLIKKEIFNLYNQLIFGLDFYISDYSNDNYDLSDILQNFTDINKTSLGYYFQDEINILENFIFSTGFRYESAKYEFDYHDNAFGIHIDENLKPNIKAYNSGLVYKYQDNSRMFFNFNRSFRFPAVDEYFSVWGTPPVNTSLKPQRSKNYELGIEHQFTPDLKFNLNLFRMQIKNELYYNPLTYANENYPRTIHEGIETGFEYRFLERFNIFSNYTYTKAIFDGDMYDKKYIPMVARHRAGWGLGFLITKEMQLNIQSNYVGKRYFINDQANIFSPLNGYVVTDLNLIYSHKDLKLTFGINNLFNKEYSEYGVYSSFSAQKGYYPSPKRNLLIKLEYQF